ncbi:MAG: S49 family peptidase [Candidatus Sulfotelmatobacter sp.]
MNYPHVVNYFRSHAWAVQESTFGTMLELVAKWERGEKFSAAEVAERISQANARQGFNRIDVHRDTVMLSGGSRAGGGGRGSSGIVALIPILGVISHRAQMLEEVSSGGGTSIQKLTSQFRAAMAEPAVRAVVFDVDSPGGSVDSVGELAQEIYESRGKKKIISVANTLAASAAYWLAAAAGEVVAAPSSMLGSVGVYASHEDHSEELRKQGIAVSLISAGKHKTEASPFEPLKDEARSHLQAMVNDFYGQFVKGVAQFRNDTQQNVRNGYGEGRTLTAVKATRANLADRVATLDEVLASLGVAGLPGSGRRAGRSQETAALASRRRKLALAAEGAIPNDDEEDAERNACNACRACQAEEPCACDVNGKSVCQCKCSACQACEVGKRVSSAQRRLDLMALSATSSAANPKPRNCRQLEHRRREMGLL